MTVKPELSRNDLAALTVLRRIVARLKADQTDHEIRMSELLRTLAEVAAMVTRGMPKTPHVSLPGWVPYLTEAEWLVLDAWFKGEDVFLHVLSELR